jgi:flavodoxin I
MSKIGIFYGSSGGNTHATAKQIAAKLGVAEADIHDVASAKADDFKPYDTLLFGSSTWGVGDLQDDWEGFIKVVAGADLSAKKVALFGCGDSSSFSDTFCDAIGHIYQAIKGRTQVIGFVDAAAYTFDDSIARIDDKFVGLAIDEDNESNLSEERISRWTEQLKTEIS